MIFMILMIFKAIGIFVFNTAWSCFIIKWLCLVNVYLRQNECLVFTILNRCNQCRIKGIRGPGANSRIGPPPPSLRGTNLGFLWGGYCSMASARARACMEVWGLCLQWGPGAEPLACQPESWRVFLLEKDKTNEMNMKSMYYSWHIFYLKTNLITDYYYLHAGPRVYSTILFCWQAIACAA